MKPASIDLVSGPRAVVGTAAELLYRVSCSVLGADRVPTAQANAWSAVLANQERAKEREELERLLSNRPARRLPTT
jgi:hypothetical protein